MWAVTERSESYRRRMLLSGVPEGADALRRLRLAVIGLIGVTAFGTLGYMVLADLTFVEALYQTVFTVATVGYTEFFNDTASTEIFTIVLIVLGVGTVLYNLGVLAEALTEGHVRQYLWRRRMDRTIEGYSGHVIVCGYGRVGNSATEHLLDTGQRVVLVDRDADRLEASELPYVCGDASADDVLHQAGIMRARALICALDTDAETTYATLSARALRPDLVIISRARTIDSKNKLVLAGATRAVNPQLIGGRRMASFALYADVAEFLDEVMHDDDAEHRIQGVRILDGSPFAGREIGDLDVAGRFGAQLLAVRAPSKGPFTATPGPATRVEIGSTLIVFGTPEQVQRVRDEANR